MSSLSLIGDYGQNSSGDSDCECEEIARKKPKLPTPDLNKVTTVQSENHLDIPAAHSGRIRSFPHVRGNWATFVYVSFSDKNYNVVSELIKKLKSLLLTFDETCLVCDDIHLSLSRTVVLQYHLITTFTKALQEALCNINSFEIFFESVEVYCNDDRTRTFIALKVDTYSEKFLLNISKKVDTVLGELRLPPFYEEPSFHSSILWVNGDKKSEFDRLLEKFNVIVSKELEKNKTPLLIDKINCKVGNKHFQYCLL